MAFSWKQSKIDAEKHLKQRIAMAEKKGDNIDANRDKIRLQRMKKIHDET